MTGNLNVRKHATSCLLSVQCMYRQMISTSFTTCHAMARLASSTTHHRVPVMQSLHTASVCGPSIFATGGHSMSSEF